MRYLTFIFILFFYSLVLLSCNKQFDFKVPDDPRIKHNCLLLQEFSSLEDLKSVIQISYHGIFRERVKILHVSENGSISSSLTSGVSQDDLQDANEGDLFQKMSVLLRAPYAVSRRHDLYRIMILSRRRRTIFGEGDIAFYDVSEKMVSNIMILDREKMSEEDLSDKGYFNSFNHITAQAFMTSIFNENFAELVARVHELKNMPELCSGDFTEDQLKDKNFGPVDNYIDMINNEWGQELGKGLKTKYGISRKTRWTPVLLAAYLNDIQNYYSNNLDIGFQAFKSTDDLVIRFSGKLNTVMSDLKEWKPKA